MPMNIIIQEKRRELGLTQEQIAQYLGVSTPAVSKWEKGITCPDIALLPSLARLLKTDLNTLFCFHEELTHQEISNFCNMLKVTVEESGIAAAFNRAEEMMRSYPNNESLMLNVALSLDSLMQLSDVSETEITELFAKTEVWYRHLSESSEPTISNVANYMDHQKMMQYQQELYAADKNLEYKTYDPFGKVYVLENLTEADDAYILRFGFMYNDLPIFGFDNEPSVQFQDGVLPPSQSYAEIIITRDGVRYFDMIGGYRIVETYESKPILSAEDAVEMYKEKWDMTLMPMPEDNWRVPLLYLEYLPVTTDDGKVLIPYWCFAREAELTNTKTGEKFWTALGGIRLNAFTGEEHAYGG